MTDTDLLDKELEHRLIEWGRWAVRLGDNIGYPTMSIEGVLQVNGGVFAQPSGPRAPEVHEAAEEIDRWLTLLKVKSPVCMEAIRLKYMSQYHTIDELARKNGMHPRTFRARIEAAKHFLSGIMFLKLEAANDKRFLSAI
jgi:hypothetical protein